MDQKRFSAPTLHNRRTVTRMCTASLLSLSLGCPVAQAGQPARPLRLAVSDVAYATLALVAEAKGYFMQEGLSLDIQHFKLGRMCVEKLVAGEVDFATAADVPALLAFMNRKEFDILATISTSKRENQMVIRQGPGITGPSDLRGKRIGVLAGTGAHYFADAFLLFHGIDQNEVIHVPLDAKDPAQALERGQVDAAGLFSSQVPDALARLQGRGIVAKQLPIYTATFNLLSQTSAAGVSDDDALKFLRALRRAERFIKDEPAQGRAIVAGVMMVSADQLAKGWEDLDFRLSLGQTLVSNLESQERWARVNGLVPGDAPAPRLLQRIRVGPLRQLDAQAARLFK
ncbi:ABC transporter substrate-binding protein [Hydrogenophaga sp. PBL-H3]|uniref:ABC transporter substrate-binding protein n=2 Tax=Hydrogenophaga sp. PBL-H3 TaxID=434010 RepID=UPI001320511F|nr:NrtA/SsuA/CpmA family ABC transporter substrate-binding protein [Hydrogenophaga sp. PBL-H3]QHE75800.1 transporter substrate-binding domain-containing protein [Hydrogenophaga sp. PBL-H3]QHE80225.1 transporter substrate-binding domain-containing protein [Hydrogenophaga sp. PBL-H3]